MNRDCVCGVNYDMSNCKIIGCGEVIMGFFGLRWFLWFWVLNCLGGVIDGCYVFGVSMRMYFLVLELNWIMFLFCSFK